MMKNHGNSMNSNNLRAFEEMDPQEQKKKKKESAGEWETDPVGKERQSRAKVSGMRWYIKVCDWQFVSKATTDLKNFKKTFLNNALQNILLGKTSLQFNVS